MRRFVRPALLLIFIAVVGIAFARPGGAFGPMCNTVSTTLTPRPKKKKKKKKKRIPASRKIPDKQESGSPMKRTVMLALQNFKTIPASLLNSNVPLDKISVPIRRLCHHMFLDTYGKVAPSRNPLFQLHSALLTNSIPLEYSVNALGSHKEVKIFESNKLGKAFCRLFLDTHFNFTYFGHMDDLLDKAPLPQYNHIRIVRVAKQDTPDYLCADSSNEIFLAEAKGRQDGTISFTSADFGKWRQQFSRVNVINRLGNTKSVKGYIVATRFKLENQKNVVSKLFAEDPDSPGDSPLGTGDEGENAGIRRMVVHNHYSSIFDILGHPLQGAALRLGVILPEEEEIVAGIWQCPIPPLDRMRFVGGYLPSDSSTSAGWWIDPVRLLDIPYLPIPREDLRRILRQASSGWNPYLGASQQTFFGLESSVVKALLQDTRTTASELPIHANELADAALPEQISLLRDGTILAPASFMRLENVVVL